MNSSQAIQKAKWMIWCMETDDGFTMVGSRKINRLDLEAEHECGDITSRFDTITATIPTVSEYRVAGSMRGFIMVTGKTEFEAFISLMNAFQEEERCEKAEAEKTAQRAKKLKKLKKAHQKAVKRAAEGKFDAAKCPKGCIYCFSEEDDGEYDYWDELYEDRY